MGSLERRVNKKAEAIIREIRQISNDQISPISIIVRGPGNADSESSKIYHLVKNSFEYQFLNCTLTLLDEIKPNTLTKDSKIVLLDITEHHFRHTHNLEYDDYPGSLLDQSRCYSPRLMIPKNRRLYSIPLMQDGLSFILPYVVLACAAIACTTISPIIPAIALSVITLIGLPKMANDCGYLDKPKDTVERLFISGKVGLSNLFSSKLSTSHKTETHSPAVTSDL